MLDRLQQRELAKAEEHCVEPKQALQFWPSESGEVELVRPQDQIVPFQRPLKAKVQRSSGIKTRCWRRFHRQNGSQIDGLLTRESEWGEPVWVR